ncbi:uncharacterized protein [Rutidosis leptorrhynchoides]|uniref:uncharacterized protein n=1 Tax=Rutidosis leptorrhynchoides TaxID=125765 RepID=UPI003A98E381
MTKPNELMSDVILADEKDDMWTWKLCRSGCFSTKCLAKVIMGKCFPPITNNTPTLRNRLVPLKVSVFVWRARQNRLPILCKLDKRGIDLHSVLYPLCEEVVETVDQALFSCKKVQEIWDRVQRFGKQWCGLVLISFGKIGIKRFLRKSVGLHRLL